MDNGKENREMTTVQVVKCKANGHGEPTAQILFDYEGENYLIFCTGPWSYDLQKLERYDSITDHVADIKIPSQTIHQAVALYKYKNMFIKGGDNYDILRAAFSAVK